MFRPTLEGGLLLVNYYGELTKNDKAKGLQIPKPGFKVGIEFPFTDAFHFGLNYSRYQLEANERSTARSLNFQSTLQQMGFGVTYNFSHILKRQERQYDPFIRIGLNAIEYNSKTDLYNSNGTPYYYWADGTIRNVAEGSQDAPKAVRVNRDYVYETDLRSNDFGNVGHYSNITLGIPIQVGIGLKVGTHAQLRFATGMQFVFTDHIDGVTLESSGVRAGDKPNDRMFYSSITLRYDLSSDNKAPKEAEDDWTKGVDIEALSNIDTDGDGIRDLDDKCPTSEPNAPVDEFGCSPDEDKDGVPDYRDAERTTPAGAWVDSNGVAYTEDELTRFRLRLLDSNGTLGVIKDTIYARTSPSTTLRQKYAKYSVQISTPDEGMSEELSAVILSNPSVKAVRDADSTSILVGQYDNLADALKQNEELQKRGIKTTAIVKENTTGSVGVADQRGVFVSDANKKDLALSDETFYRIQVGAFKGKPDYSKYGEKIPNLVAIPSPDGLTRYYSGYFKNYDDAMQAKVKLFGATKIEGMSVKAFGSEHVSERMKNASDAPIENAENPALVEYQVSLGTYSENIPGKLLVAMLKIKGVKEIDQADGATLYEMGRYSTYREAEDAVMKAKSAGIESAEINAFYDSKPISIDKAKSISGN